MNMRVGLILATKEAKKLHGWTKKYAGSVKVTACLLEVGKENAKAINALRGAKTSVKYSIIVSHEPVCETAVCTGC